MQCTLFHPEAEQVSFFFFVILSCEGGLRKTDKPREMETPEVELEQSSVSALSPSSSSSSSASSSSCNASVVPVPFSPVQAGTKNGIESGPDRLLLEGDSGSFLIERLRFLGPGCGRVWKQVEDRFDRIALEGKQGEPAVNWSRFGFCVGRSLPKEKKTPVYYIYIFIYHKNYFFG